jgi:hypothetical protein
MWLPSTCTQTSVPVGQRQDATSSAGAARPRAPPAFESSDPYPRWRATWPMWIGVKEPISLSMIARGISARMRNGKALSKSWSDLPVRRSWCRRRLSLSFTFTSMIRHSGALVHFWFVPILGRQQMQQQRASSITLESAMSYCHLGFDWCSEAVANAVGGKCISYVGGNLCLCLVIQASNCWCDRGCCKVAWHIFSH